MLAPISVGKRFIQLIQHLGLSKNAFAQSLDKTATVIQHLVDERNKPGYDLLCKVFEMYPNVSTDWLLLGQGPMMAAARAAAPTAFTALAAPAPVELANFIAASAPVVAANVTPVVAPAPAPASPLPMPVIAPFVPAVVASAAPDPAYLTVALQTQYLQHQLALAEQRNQHLLEQQALMQQMVALLQRTA